MIVDHTSGGNRYKTIFEHSLHAIFIKLPDGAVIESNAAALRMFGYTAGEFQRLRIQDLVIFPDTVIPENLLNKPVPVAVTAIARNGQRFACWYSSLSFADENGGTCICCMLADITGSWQHSGQLLREKDLSDTIINSLPGIFYLFNTEGRFIRWNKNFETVSGYTPEEIARMHPLDFFGSADKALIAERVEEVFVKGRSDAEASFLTKDGRQVPHYFSGTAIEFENQVCLIGMGIDITLRVQAEQGIRERNERFHIVAKATNDNIWDWNLLTNEVTREGKKLEEWYGYTSWQPAEVDKYWNLLAHPDDWPRVTARRRAIFADPSRSYWEDEYRFKKSDGEYAYVYDRGYILRDTEGRAVRMIGASQDITGRKKDEEELKEKNKELKRLSVYLQNVREEERKYMAREVHDELGQLASALKIDLDWLTLRISSSEETMRNRLSHARKTVEVLIDSVRKMAYSLRPSILDDFGLNAALKSYCREFERLSGCECVFSATLDEAELDMHTRTELFRIGQESLTNVMRHAHATRVTVSTYEENGMYCLKITDNGRGFDTSQFSQTLGLVGLRERVGSLNGKLLLESGIGRGTEIRVEIPRQS
ncbi:PAS domain-containing sensor histidine kinase [Sediminibacterium soli]|uniref:PAS domain-containing sensor histidine kinase n=1 Tax=Sediminibacterium soli TaxID=2698829 RepID=UPI00137A400E|nr:PAS domain-containing sensor histidine kinase [Sediminibacterium soli]NCI46599.1 PAS domain S-box protein [Sediminibacterium soli]